MGVVFCHANKEDATSDFGVETFLCIRLGQNEFQPCIDRIDQRLAITRANITHFSFPRRRKVIGEFVNMTVKQNINLSFFLKLRECIYAIDIYVQKKIGDKSTSSFESQTKPFPNPSSFLCESCKDIKIRYYID